MPNFHVIGGLSIAVLVLTVSCVSPTVVPTLRPLATSTPVSIGMPTVSPQLLLPNIANIVDEARSAVVNIVTTKSVQTFFGPQQEVSSGTGFIIGHDGTIVTNNHVVSGAQKLTVTLHDTSTWTAVIVGMDLRSDLAVLKIDSPVELPTLPFGDSEDLRIGDWVIAIGHALGLEGGPTVTLGVVGALDRVITVSGGRRLYGTIQTDAAINQGNSGGPLLDLSVKFDQNNSCSFISLSHSLFFPIRESSIVNTASVNSWGLKLEISMPFFS